MFNFFSNGINLFARFSVNKHKFTSNFDCRTVEFTLDPSDSLFFCCYNPCSEQNRIRGIVHIQGIIYAVLSGVFLKFFFSSVSLPFMEYRFEDCRKQSERKNHDFNNQTYKRREQGHKNHKQQNQKQSAENDLQ